MEKKVEQICTENGLQGEKVTYANGSEIVTEFYIEDPRPKPLKKRVTETKKEIVAERKIESFEKDQLVEMKVESLEPKVQPQLVEHKRYATEESSSDYVTKEELKSFMSELVRDIKGERPIGAMQLEVGEKLGLNKVKPLDILLCLAVVIAAGVAGYIWLM